MRFSILIMLLPFISFSQKEISVIINGSEITNPNECPFYVEFKTQKINLLDSNIYPILLELDSFYITANIYQVNFKSNSLKLMKMVKDSIAVRFDSVAESNEIGVFITHEKSTFRKFHIISLRDNCIYFINKTNSFVSCKGGPAYYLDGKAIYDEDSKTNRKIKRRQRKIKHKAGF